MITKDLLEIIGLDAAEDHGYCNQPTTFKQFEKGPPYYWDWEKDVAIPRLRALGYTIDYRGFTTGDGDSFGPLTRVIRVEKNGQRMELMYG